MTAMITLDVGDLHRWTETEGEATAEYENSLLRCRPHLRDIQRYTIPLSCSRNWGRDGEAVSKPDFATEISSVELGS